MKRTPAVLCGVCLALGCVAAPALAGPNDKKPVRKPVIDLDATAKQRRPGQVLPGDVSPAAPAPSAPPKPAEAPAPAPAPAPTPPPALPAPILTSQPAQPARPGPASTPRRKAAPAPKLRATAGAVAPTPAAAQVRRFGLGEGAWLALTADWAGEVPIEVRVGVHAPVVIRLEGVVEPDGPAPATLVTLWPMARAVIGPELVDGRWIPVVSIARGQATVQLEFPLDPDAVLPDRWAAVVRTPDRAVPIAGIGGRVAYDPVRRTRVWSLLAE